VTQITKAVLPAAGLGTRFLPASKAIPKEMLPLVDKPVIQYAVEEALAAGIEEIIIVSSRGKGVMMDHFDRHGELDAALEAKGKTAELAAVRGCEIPAGRITEIRQPEALGLGHAVWCARKAVGDVPFAVLLPDDVVRAPTPCLAQMVAAQAEQGGNMVAVEEVPPEATDRYGILDPGAESAGGRLVPVAGLVEKPEPGRAPSNLAIIGRYILQPEIFAELDRFETGAGGEIQLTDAMARLIGRQPFSGLRFEGRRYDCGSKQGFVEANVAFALDRPDLAEGLRAALGRLLDGDSRAA